MRRLVGVVLIGLTGWATPAWAQPPTCEAERLEWRLLAEQVIGSRQRAEVDAAQAMARMLRRIEALEQALAAEKSARGQTPTPEGK